MWWRLLLEEYTPEIVHIAGITSMAANDIIRIDMDPACNVSEEILKSIDESDYIHGKQMHLTRVLSQVLIGNTDLGKIVGRCFANMAEVVGDFAFPTMAQINKKLIPPNNSFIMIEVNITL